MEDNPLVSVVMTVYNKPQWLKQSIESVNSQTYGTWELIIMEDNSPNPEVKEILREYESHPKMQVHYHDTSDEERFETTRYATLINEAVRQHSSGSLITYIGDDDFFYNYRLKDMIDSIIEYEVDVVYGSQHFCDVNGNVSGYRKTRGILSNAWDKVDHNSVLHTRRSFDAVDGWDDNKGTWGGADSYFWRKLNHAGFSFYPVGDMPGEVKRYHEESVQWQMSNNQFFPEGFVQYEPV